LFIGVFTDLLAARRIISLSLHRAVQVQTRFSTPPSPNTIRQKLPMIPVLFVTAFVAGVIITVNRRRRPNTLKRRLSERNVHGVDFAKVPTDDSCLFCRSVVASHHIDSGQKATGEEDDVDDIKDKVEQAGPEEVGEQEAAAAAEPDKDMQISDGIKRSRLDDVPVIPLTEVEKLARRPSSFLTEEKGFVRRRKVDFDQKEELFRLSKAGAVLLQGVDRIPSNNRTCIEKGSVHHHVKFFDQDNQV